MKYSYVWLLRMHHEGGAASLMVFKTKRKAKKSAKLFSPEKGWATSIEELVLN